MYIKKLLRTPIPYPYESLGNYYFRLAYNNSIDIKMLNKKINCFNSKYLSSYNQIKDERILSNIGVASNLDISTIKEMTVHIHLTFFEKY